MVSMADSIVKFLVRAHFRACRGCRTPRCVPPSARVCHAHPQVHKDGKVVQELPVTAFKKIAVGRLESADWCRQSNTSKRICHACM